VGTLLYDTRLYGTNVRGTLNVWFANYDEARRQLDEVRAGGNERYLLSFRTQFFLVDRHFIQDLGCDPADQDWEKIGFDWPRLGAAATLRQASAGAS
jgi:hypothetical protein